MCDGAWFNNQHTVVQKYQGNMTKLYCVFILVPSNKGNVSFNGPSIFKNKCCKRNSTATATKLHEFCVQPLLWKSGLLQCVSVSSGPWKVLPETNLYSAQIKITFCGRTMGPLIWGQQKWRRLFCWPYIKTNSPFRQKFYVERNGRLYYRHLR